MENAFPELRVRSHRCNNEDIPQTTKGLSAFRRYSPYPIKSTEGLDTEGNNYFIFYVRTMHSMHSSRCYTCPAHRRSGELRGKGRTGTRRTGRFDICPLIFKLLLR